MLKYQRDSLEQIYLHCKMNFKRAANCRSLTNKYGHSDKYNPDGHQNLDLTGSGFETQLEEELDLL